MTGIYWVEVLIEMVPADDYVAQLQDFKAEGCLQGELNTSRGLFVNRA